MTPIKSRPLIDQEIEELDAFLLSDDGLENAMDVSGLDGFLCAVLSGPNVIMPSEWMRYYEPLFLARDHKGRTVSIVDEWCCGYVKGIAHSTLRVGNRSSKRIPTGSRPS